MHKIGITKSFEASCIWLIYRILLFFKRSIVNIHAQNWEHEFLICTKKKKKGATMDPQQTEERHHIEKNKNINGKFDKKVLLVNA